MRNVVIHHHVVPSASDALEQSFSYALEDRFVRFRSALAENARSVTGPEMRNFLRTHPLAIGVTSEWFATRFFREYDGPEYNAEFCFHHVALVAHPFARARALYALYRNGFGDDVEALVLARRLSLREWLETLLARAPHVINDTQVGLFAKYGKRDGPPSNRDLRRATRRLTDFTVIGTVERFAETVVLAEADLRPAFGTLDLAPAAHVPPVVDDSAEDLGKRLAERLRHANRLDEEFWLRVGAEMDRRRSTIVDFGERMRDLEGRTARRIAMRRNVALDLASEP